MADSIESFVAKLQTEGVKAAKEQAEKIRAEAQTEAQDVLRKAEEQAEKILADANAEADRRLARSKTELELAARDTVFKLREALTRVLESLLRSQVQTQLSSAEFLQALIRDVVAQYTSADREGRSTIVLNIPEAQRGSLEAWILQELQASAASGQGGVDLRSTLKQAGFEVRVQGAAVEVTVESVVETLREMVGTALKERLDAVTKGGESGGR